MPGNKSTIASLSGQQETTPGTSGGRLHVSAAGTFQSHPGTRRKNQSQTSESALWFTTARWKSDIRGVDERKAGGGGLNWTNWSQQSKSSGTLAIGCFTWTAWFWVFFQSAAETRREHLSVASKGTRSPVYLSPGCITGVRV